MKTTITNEREAILSALSDWINQRPGLDPRNYDRAGYAADSRRITQQKRDAHALLAQVSWRGSITADDLKIAFGRAFMGRLQWKEAGHLEYCTGQYWPTEYRAAACAVLASVLWHYWREAMSATEGKPTGQPGIVNMGDAIRRKARAELGQGIASRWFN